MQQSLTHRVCVNNLENIIEKEFKVLNKGFVRLIDYMGDDSSIVQSARVSYGKGTKTLQTDENLIRYLLKHKHTTPFEMCEIKLHIKAPIFIARQWLRHRTANVNEYSARYSEMENDYYLPNLDQVAVQSSSNKQGRGEIFNTQDAQIIVNEIQEVSEKSFSLYEKFIGKNNSIYSEKPLAKEIARTVLPVNFYTQFYWKIDLHNLLHFLKLRAHSHAQYEIRVYAEVILDIVKQWVPMAYKAFVDYQQESATISKNEINLIKDLINGKATLENINLADYNLSSRDLNALKLMLDLE